MQGSQPPGPPPRPGLEWKASTHRWIRPGGEHERKPNKTIMINLRICLIL